jgi:hypothetical protein
VTINQSDLGTADDGTFQPKRRLTVEVVCARACSGKNEAE